MLHPEVSTLTGVDFALYFEFFSTSSQGKIPYRAKSVPVKSDTSHCTLVGLSTDPAPLIISNFFKFKVLWS